MTNHDPALHARISRKVRHLLIDCELTQVELATRIGIRESTLSKMLNGSQPWDIEDVYRAADALGVRADDLVQWGGRDSNSQPVVKKVQPGTPNLRLIEGGAEVVGPPQPKDRHLRLASRTGVRSPMDRTGQIAGIR